MDRRLKFLPEIVAIEIVILSRFVVDCLARDVRKNHGTRVSRVVITCQASQIPYWRAARELVPTRVVLRFGYISRSETTTSMVLRSQVRGGRSFVAIPELETRPDVEFPPETEVENPAEIEVSVSTIGICEWDLGAARPITVEKPPEQSDLVSKFVFADKPETTATFPASQEISVEINPNATFHTTTSPNRTFHNIYGPICVRAAVLKPK